LAGLEAPVTERPPSILSKVDGNVKVVWVGRSWTRGDGCGSGEKRRKKRKNFYANPKIVIM
jgi:hypothetical protein